MITRKAAIGFILLAIIVFVTASMSDLGAGSIALNKSAADETRDISLQRAYWNGLDPYDREVIIEKPPVYKYRPPILNFGAYNPYVVTAIIELFTLMCYLGLKRIEPRIKAWEMAERETARKWQEEENH